METTIRVKPNELNQDFLEKIKAFFKDEDSIEISFSSIDDFGLTKKEGKETYIKRINKAINNLETGQNIVKITEKDFNELIKDLKIKK